MVRSTPAESTATHPNRKKGAGADFTAPCSAKTKSTNAVTLHAASAAGPAVAVSATVGAGAAGAAGDASPCATADTVAATSGAGGGGAGAPAGTSAGPCPEFHADPCAELEACFAEAACAGGSSHCHCGVMPWPGSLRCGGFLYTAVECPAVQWNALQYSAVQCPTVQCSGLLDSRVQWGALQYSALMQQVCATQERQLHYTAGAVPPLCSSTTGCPRGISCTAGAVSRPTGEVGR